jgi:hypothetical protein
MSDRQIKQSGPAPDEPYCRHGISFGDECSACERELQRLDNEEIDYGDE